MPDEHSDSVPAPAPSRPPQVPMGLLDHITAHSLDEDYAQAAQRRPAGGPRKRVGPGVAGLVILGVFGLLIATAGVQTSKDAPATEDSRASLITQIQSRRDQLDARRGRVNALQFDVSRLQGRLLDLSSDERSLQTRLDRLGASTGAFAVTGPGVRVVVDDDPDATEFKQRVNDKDMQKLVNGLWQAGAEAVAINNQRLSSLSAIRIGGSAITVNFTSLKRPYVVSAIGDPDQLQARFAETAGGSYWLLEAQTLYGLQFDMTSEESLKLPAANLLTLRHAETSGIAG